MTNPGNRSGRVDLVFYEVGPNDHSESGYPYEIWADGDFSRSDWAGGSFTAPPKWQRYYRPAPRHLYGQPFVIYGWFELWTDVDDMVFDISVRRSETFGLDGSLGPHVETISERTLPPQRRRPTLTNVLRESLGFRARSPLLPRETQPKDLTSAAEPVRPDD